MTATTPEQRAPESHAVTQMRRGLTALHLEVHADIVATMAGFFDAVVAEHAGEVAAAEARGMERAAGIADAISYDTRHTLDQREAIGFVRRGIRAAIAVSP